jgi:hypothetical protein
LPLVQVEYNGGEFGRKRLRFLHTVQIVKEQ